MRRALILAVAAAGATTALIPGVAHAQDPVCPAGTYWDAAVSACVAVNVYVNPPNPVVGPVGPVGVGGVIGPVGPGPVGPGPVGPGPLGPGR